MKMKIIAAVLCSLAICLPLVTSQFEEGTQQQAPKKWFWNSTTSTSSSQTDAESSAKSTTEATTVHSKSPDSNATDESQLFSPGFFEEGGFIPANLTSGRNAFVAELFSSDLAPANLTSGRSSKAMNLDFLGNIREGRIMNDDPGNRKLSLQGFIPIVSFSGKDDDDAKPLSKSPKRIQEDEVYYDKGPYPPQPIDNEEQTKSQNYYIPAPNPSLSESYKNHKQSYEEISNTNQQQRQYGARLQQGGKQTLNDFYIPPPQHQQQQQSEQNRYAVAPQKEVVRYITADDYHKRPNYQDATKAESQSGHFVVSSKPSKDDDNVAYAPAGPYPPEPLPQGGYKETTAKQFRPGNHQFDQEAIYELSNGNYIVNNEQGLGEDKCVCVPFYLCRNGYLANYGRSLEKDPIDERSARKISKRSPGNETAESKDEAVDDNFAPYTADVMARMIGLGNVGQSCGLLRKCCRVPRRGDQPGGLLPFSTDNYQIPHPTGDFGQLPPGILPPGFQGLPIQGDNHNTYIVNHEPQYQGGRPQEQHIVVVQQEVHPPHRRPTPVYPQPKPVFPPPQQRPRPDPHRSRPVYPHRKAPHAPVFESNYQPQQSYPQPQQTGLQNHPNYPQPQQSYPPPQPIYTPRPPKVAYPRPDYTEPAPQIHHGQCGARNGLGVHGRVNNLQYHDDASEFGEYPWQAAILLKVGPGNNLFVCGGTLISNLWVATAAHCLKKHHAEELKIRLGDWDVHRDDEFYPYVEKFVTEVVVHPDFYPGNLQNDLALLRLESPVDPSLPHISPACLPEPHERFDSTRCWVTGWGKNAFGEQGEYQSVLKEVDIPLLSHKDCEYRLKQTRLGRSYQLHPGFLCAGGEPGKDACTGDGGSPLVCEHQGTWKVAGLVSWGIGCGQPGVPGIYVNMAKYRTWIDTVLNRYG